MASISIAPSDRVFVLTGAGISAESGLPAFRASDGLWAGYRIEEVCTPEALWSNPANVWAFYSARREGGFAAKPNAGHIALAELEQKLGGRYFLCTQNVDDLHERAGSEHLVHMHGELAKSRCSQQCGEPPVEDRRVYKSLDDVGRCVCGARLRPHIVFFGEIPLEMPRIERELRQSTVMIVIGTSGSVYPAAGFAQQARFAGARTIYIGPEPPLNASVFSQSITGNAAAVLPGLFEVQS